MVEDPAPSGFKMSRKQYARVLDLVGLGGFPRYAGTPKQVPAGSPASFVAWWEKNYHEPVPLFLSHNRFESFGDRSRIVFSTAFGDFDTGDGSGLSPAEVYDDVQRTAKFMLQKNLDHVWLYSGSEAGFHLVVFFKKEVRDRKYLERWENAFWRGLKNELRVRSINIKCANPVCLRRLPFSRHVHKKDPAYPGEYVFDGNYCVPIPYAWVSNGLWGRVRELSAHPTLEEGIRYSSGIVLPSLEACVLANGWGAFGHEPGELHPAMAETPKGSMAEYVKVYIPDRLCLQTLPFGTNPRHHVRLAFVHELIAVGLSSGMPFSYDELLKLIVAVGKEAGWEDLNEVECAKQVGYAVAKPYALDRETGNARPHGFSCAWLRENGVCIGAACKVFKIAFPADWAEHLKAHPEDAR